MHVCWLMITCGVHVCVVYVNQCLLKQFICVYCLTPVCMCVAACMVSQVHVCMFTNTNNVRSWEFDVVSSFWLWFYHLAAATTPRRRCLHVFLPHVFLLHVGVAYLVLISITCSFCIWLHMRRRMKAHLSSVAACNRLLFVWRSSLRCSVLTNGLALTRRSSRVVHLASCVAISRGPGKCQCVLLLPSGCMYGSYIALWKVYLGVAHSGCSLATVRHGSLL